MATDKPRYTVSVDNDLFQKIEDFRFERRFQTRSEATVELIRLGLEALEKEGSSNFVVVRVILNGHSWYPLFPDLTSPIHE